MRCAPTAWWTWPEQWPRRNGGVTDKIGTEYKKFIGFEPLPDESQCPECLYFDDTHPDVQRILRARDQSEHLLRSARCKCRGLQLEAQHKQEMRWQQSNVKSDYKARTFENFHVSDSTHAMYQACVDFSKGNGPPVLVLVGQVGVGKSHLLEATVRVTVERQRQARYEMVSLLLDRLRSCYEMDSEEDLMGLMGWYQGRYLLALDDMGLEKGTDWAQEKLTALIEERIRMGWRTLVSTNLVKDELAERLGDRLASRLYATNPNLSDVRLVVVNAEDYRVAR